MSSALKPKLSQEALTRAEHHPGGADRLHVRAEPDFDFLSEAYRGLFARSRATAFQHPVWLDAFYRNLIADRGAEKLVVCGRDGSDALRFALPLIRRRRSGAILVETTDLGVGDYAAPVVDTSWEPCHGLHRRVGAALPPFDILRLRPVRAEALPDWQLFFDARETQLDFSAHAVALSSSFQEWRSGVLDTGFLRMLDRKKKRFAREGGAVARLEGADAMALAVEALAGLRAGRFEGDLIQRSAVAGFYADVARQGAGGFARVYTASIGGDAIGHVLGIVHGGRFHYLLIGCDYARFGRLSPGMMLYDAMIEDWIGEGGTVFDFTIGDEPFKRDFGTVPTAMHQLVAPGSWRGRLALAAFEARSSLRALGRNRIDGG